MLVEFAGKVAMNGTVATLGSLELTSIVNPPVGAGAERFRINAWVAPGLSDMLGGANVMIAVTRTAAMPVLKPGADAVMLAAPKPAPVTCGCVDGVVCPASIV